MGYKNNRGGSSMVKIIVTDELLDELARKYEEDKNGMTYGQYVDFKVWCIENQDQLRPHNWVRQMMAEKRK